jgi:hypothetical protein
MRLGRMGVDWAVGGIMIGGLSFIITDNFDIRNGLAITQGYDMDGTRIYGLVDFAGREVIPPRYTHIGNINNGRSIVTAKGNWDQREGEYEILYGVIDERGNEIIAPQKDHIWPFSYWRAVIGQNRIIDTYGENILISDNISAIIPFTNGLAVFQQSIQTPVFGVNVESFKYGYMNTLGEEVIPARFDGANRFFDGLAAVKRFISTQQVTNPVTGLRSREAKWAFIDITGEYITDYRFDMVRDFHNGMAAVAVNDGDGRLRWGFINTAGELVVPMVHAWAGDFHEGFAVVNRDADIFYHRPIHTPLPPGVYVLGGSYMLIDIWGREVLSLSGFDAVGHVSEGKLAVNVGWRLSGGSPNSRYLESEGLWGFIEIIQ